MRESVDEPLPGAAVVVIVVIVLEFALRLNYHVAHVNNAMASLFKFI